MEATPSSTLPQNPDIMEQRLRFIEIDAETVEALDEYLPMLASALPGILEEFYAHIAQWPDLAGMFKNQDRMDFARKAQQSHWMQLFEAKLDEAYVSSVRRIGLVHSKIGLEPTWYIGAYGFTLNRLYAHAAAQYQSRFAPHQAREKTIRLMRAINQCVMVDMDMAISIYLEENKNTYDKKLTQLAETFETSIGSIIDNVSAAASQLEASARALADMSTKTSTGAEKVALTSDQASNNIAAVSSATEEMSASIAQIAELADKSYRFTEEVSQQTLRSSEEMVQLGQTIQNISEVANIISTIAEQTNLLALNATIEAARAGDAGKGFSVVASEVKTLANNTTKATERIKTQVSNIIERSNETASSLELVQQTISQSTSMSHETAKAVVQQKEAVQEIAQNVEQTASGTQDIAANIQNISQSAQNVRDSAEGILNAAQDLAQQGVHLKTTVRDFIESIRTY